MLSLCAQPVSAGRAAEVGRGGAEAGVAVEVEADREDVVVVEAGDGVRVVVDHLKGVEIETETETEEAEEEAEEGDGEDEDGAEGVLLSYLLQPYRRVRMDGSW